MHDGVQDKSILSETGNELRMILSPPGDCHLGLVNVLGLQWHDGVHPIFVPEVVPLFLLRSGEDVVLLEDSRIVILALVRPPGSRLMLAVLLTVGRLLRRQPR
jgi:hypothetical protein